MRHQSHELLALFVLISPLTAQDVREQDLAAQHRARTEQAYAAASWALGPVRAGLANELDFDGFVAPGFEADAGRVVRRFHRPDAEQPAFLVTSHVADTAAAAHADLVTWLAGLQSPQRMPSVEGLGDVAYMGASGAAEGAVAWVAFLRGNVFVRLSNFDAHLEPGLALVDMARAIDLTLLEAPQLVEGARPARPMVQTLSLSKTEVVAGARVHLEVEVADANGGKPHLQWTLGGAGLGYVERAADGELYLHTTGPGRIDLELEATSSMGTYTRAQVSLEVWDD